MGWDDGPEMPRDTRVDASGDTPNEPRPKGIRPSVIIAFVAADLVVLGVVLLVVFGPR